MAYIQRNVPRPNAVHSFGLKDFSGGLNNRSDTLQPNESSDLLNMKFSNDTLMEKRFGTALDRTYEKVDGKIIYMDTFKPYKDADERIRATATAVYADGKKIKDVTGRINGVNYLGKFIFLDGTKLFSYGKFPQESKTYEKVKGEIVDKNVVFELVKTPEGYTPLDTGHVRGVMNYDYDTLTMWYEPCQLEMEDTYSGAQVLPESPKYLAVHKGRLFVSGLEKDDDNVFISDIQNPYYFPTYLPVQLPPNSDKVRGLAIYDDGIIVGRESDIYVITGNTNNPQLGGEMFTLRKINSHTGVMNQDTMVTAHSFFLYLGSDGEAYALSSFRNDQKVLSTAILSNQVDFTKHPYNIKKDELKDSISIFFDDVWYIQVGSKTIVYSYRHRAWTYYEGIKATFYMNDKETLIWGDAEGNTLKHSEDFIDLEVPYISYWKSCWFDMGEPIAEKFYRDFFVVAHVYDAEEGDLTFATEVDYRDTKDLTTIKSDIAKWGKSTFGSLFISRNIAKSPSFPIGTRGRTIRFTIRNGYSYGEPVATRSELEKHPAKVNGMVVKLLDEKTFMLYSDEKWTDIDRYLINQRMKVYEINGEFELRMKR